MINVLVLIIFAQKSIEVVYMSEPDMSVNARSLFKDEVEEIGLLNLDVYNLNIGFTALSYDEETKETSYKYPLETDSVDSYMYNQTDFSFSKVQESIPCTNLFSTIDDLSDSDRLMIAAGSCIDPR